MALADATECLSRRPFVHSPLLSLHQKLRYDSLPWRRQRLVIRFPPTWRQSSSSPSRTNESATLPHLFQQGDLMLTLVEVLGAELNKKASMIFLHNLKGIVEGVVKTSSVAQDEPEDVGRVGVRILTGSSSDT